MDGGARGAECAAAAAYRAAAAPGAPDCNFSAQEALPAEVAVLKSLYNSDAGHEIGCDQELRLLLTAAALGNAGALALLLGRQDMFEGDADAVTQLLQFAVQYRSGALLQLTVPLLHTTDLRSSMRSVSEVAMTSLLRAGDMTQLKLVATELAAVWPED
jgi:hypothetical protein